MTAFTFQDLLRAVVATILAAWRPCQPLLAAAALVALAVAALVGLVLPGEGWDTLAALPMMLLTLAVSAGVAGYIVSGASAFTRLDTVLREPRAYAFVLRYLLLSLGLSLPVLAILPTIVASGGAGAGAAMVGLGVALVTLWLAARLAPFPYSVFLGQPMTLAEAFRATSGHALKIVGCIVLFAGMVLMTVALATLLAGALIQGLAGATGLGGGAAAGLALQSLGQIAVAYVVDCVYGTITRFVVGGGAVTQPVDEA